MYAEVAFKVKNVLYVLIIDDDSDPTDVLTVSLLIIEFIINVGCSYSSEKK